MIKSFREYYLELEGKSGENSLEESGHSESRSVPATNLFGFENTKNNIAPFQALIEGATDPSFQTFYDPRLKIQQASHNLPSTVFYCLSSSYSSCLLLPDCNKSKLVPCVMDSKTGIVGKFDTNPHKPSTIFTP